MHAINQIADFIIFRLTSEDVAGIPNLKLQKLLYYVQAWHLAFYQKPFFDGKFQAWIHGPVNREIYDRFKENKLLYSTVDCDDLLDRNINETIDEKTQEHINNILESYARFSGTELEIMTHREDPWFEARKGFPPMERCENEISEQTMKSYYGNRLSK
jgi:uncharacterized phage-associated protein